MYGDYFKTATEGWYIISRHRVDREGARQLLYLLVEALNASAAGILFLNPRLSYGWEERVDRDTPETAVIKRSSPEGKRWKHPFPEGQSYWYFEGTEPPDDGVSSLLNLLAEQWLRINNPYTLRGPGPGLHGKWSTAVSLHPAWIAVTRASRSVLSRLAILSHSSCPLLIVGEHGSGRNHLAGLIHRNGPDPSASFIRGYPAEGFTGSGTLYVPDWTDLNWNEQISILERPERIIAAALPSTGNSNTLSNWKLATRGSGSTLILPALRDRKDDIPLLAGFFLEQLSTGSGNPSPVLTSTAVDALRTYCWPGNAGELKETMALVFGCVRNGRISLADLPPAIRGAVLQSSGTKFPDQLGALEYEALREELGRQKGNMARTAGALGLTPRQVSWRIRKYGLNPGEFKPERRL